MRALVACVLLLSAFGCAHEPPAPRAPARVIGVRTDLSGVNAQTLRALVKLYVREGKVFLYASQYTDSPVVEKQDVPFAMQFATVPVYGGFREAQEFNRMMLAYMRDQARKGLCPEHRGVPLKAKMVKEKLPPAGKKGRKALTARPREAERRIFVCPVDNRAFSP